MSILHKYSKLRIHNAIIISTIFTTKNKELAVFGQTLSDINKKLVNFNDIWMQGGRLGSNKAQIIPEENLTKVLSFDEASTQLESFNTHVVQGGMKLDDYFEKYQKGNTILKNYVTTTNQQEQSTQGLVKAYQEARAAQIAQNEAIKSSTLSAKAATIATKALAVAGNMIAMWAITKVISIAVEKIDDLAHASEKCAERVTELMSSYESALDTANSNAAAVEELADRYEKLSKGVNRLGENVSLTTDEYTEYNDIVNQIAEMFPSLVQGYTDEGNAILSLKGNVEQLRNAYKEAQQEAYNMLIVSGKDSGGNDIIEYADQIINGTFFKSGNAEIINYLNEVSDALESREELEKYQETLMNLSGQEIKWFYDFTGLQNGFNVEDLTDANLAVIKNNIEALKQTYQAEITSALKDMRTLANAYLKTNEGYTELDEESKNAASIIVNSINENIANGFENKIDVGAYVTSIVNILQNNEECRDALVDLFTLKYSDMPVEEAKSIIDMYLQQIASSLGESLDALKIRLGFDDIYDINTRLNNSLRQITDDHGISDREEYAKLEEYTKDFNQSQADLWLEVTLGTENATEAIKKYEEALQTIPNETDILFADIFSFEDEKGTLTSLGKISESMDAIQNAYKTLNDAIDEYNETGAFSIDTLQSVIALGDNWLDYLVDEEGNLKLDKESLQQLTLSRLNDMRVQALNNIIDNVSKIQSDADATQYLTSTNYALAESYEAVAQASMEAAATQIRNRIGDTLSSESAESVISKMYADADKINKLFSNINIDDASMSGGSSSSSSSTASTIDEYEELFDFFERRIDVLNDAISLLDANLENVNGSFAKNKLLSAQSSIYREELNNYTDALAMYQQKANEALSSIPDDIAEKIKNGAVELTTFIGESSEEVVDAIEDYENWSDKVADCNQQLANLNKTLRDLELEKFNNIIQDFTDQFDLRNNSIDLIDKQVALFEEAGQLIGESFYTAQKEQAEKQLTLLNEERSKLAEQLSSALSTGLIVKGTDEWYEMISALTEVDGSILDCKKSIEEFDNAILDLNWQIFERIQSTFSNLNSELENFVGLLDDIDVADNDTGAWTIDAISKLGLLTQQYELSQYQVEQYNQAIAELKQQYSEGKYSSIEYADKLAELSQAQWDAVNTSESIKDAIMDLNETRISEIVNGINKEITAYKELIDAQIKSLEVSKDLHDYEKSIAEKTKSITDLERQIAAMANDNTLSTIAKRKKLEAELLEAKSELEETQYEHSIEEQKNALNQQYEDYENTRNNEIEVLQESLGNQEQIISQSFETVKQNADLIGQQIEQIAREHGINISDSLTSSWAQGENAIASYGEVLTVQTSAFIENVIDVENEIWTLQTNANDTANSLSSMFSTRADNLINELTNSYYVENNVISTTNALQQSLINTLERGYDISNITMALNSIENAAKSTASALASIGSANIENTPKTYSIHQVGSVNPTYTVRDNLGNIVSSGNTLSEAQEFIKKNSYASGTRNAKGGLRIVNEEGNELQLKKLSSGNYEIGNAGDQILTKEQTDNIFDWSKFKPIDILSKGNIINDLHKIDTKYTSSPINIESKIIFTGAVNDANNFAKQIAQIANNQITKSWQEFGNALKY